MKRTTSLAAAVTATAIIATPVAGTATAATSTQSATLAAAFAPLADTAPAAGDFRPDPLKVLALPFSNYDLIAQSAFVFNGTYKKNQDGKYISKDGKSVLRDQKVGESSAEYAAYLKENGVPQRVIISQAISDSVNNVALKGDFAKAAAQIQWYLEQLATQFGDLPQNLIQLNVKAFFPGPEVARLSATSAAAPNPFAMPDLNALLTVGGIPFKNFDQARKAAFVEVNRNCEGGYCEASGKLITDKARIAKLDGSGGIEEVFIFQAISDEVNGKALQLDFGGAATLIQKYLGEVAGNYAKLPTEVLRYDMNALHAAFPTIPAYPGTTVTEGGGTGGTQTGAPNTVTLAKAGSPAGGASQRTLVVTPNSTPTSVPSSVAGAPISPAPAGGSGTDGSAVKPSTSIGDGIKAGVERIRDGIDNLGGGSKPDKQAPTESTKTETSTGGSTTTGSTQASSSESASDDKSDRGANSDS